MSFGHQVQSTVHDGQLFAGEDLCNSSVGGKGEMDKSTKSQECAVSGVVFSVLYSDTIPKGTCIIIVTVQSRPEVIFFANEVCGSVVFAFQWS